MSFLKKWGFLLLMMNIASITWGSSHHPQDFLKEISGSNNAGEHIVHHFCIHCHDRKPRIPVGAPRIGVTSDWEPRVKRGLDVLFKHTDEGLNAMPARGGCFECSDQQLLEAILVMLPQTMREKFSGTQKDHNKNN
ncbi:c-type cytochrome [Legionella nagasakiensis]|uniref:c-type cytochrome n=1 Tax=Legionella nagasakiensis TaxID=535290 RepID=UPI0013EF7F51|nr:c-type cytochrome [Legionella nagasakiensis]